MSPIHPNNQKSDEIHFKYNPVFNAILSSIISLIIITSAFTSCNSAPPKETPVLKFLGGNVYKFAEYIDTVNCKAYGEGDCDSDDLLFLNEKQFIFLS